MKESKNRKIEAKCTAAEHATVLKMASKNNMTVAEFVRAKVLFDPMPKYNQFEFRAMKLLCAAAGWIQTKAGKLSDEEFAEFEANVNQLKRKNDVSEDPILDEETTD